MQFKSFARLLCALTGILVLAGGARAQECLPACKGQSNACFGTANVAMLTCKAKCRATRTQIGACSRACTDAFKKSKDTCRTDLASCRDACTKPPVACPGQCGQALAACTKLVVGKQKDCLGTCKTASDKPGCVSACLTAAQAGNVACKASFEGCLAGCGGSPSGAFVDTDSPLL